MRQARAFGKVAAPPPIIARINVERSCTMKRKSLALPEIGLIAATRAAAGAGIALLLADRLKEGPRKAVGWTLLGVGALTTIPILIQLLSSDEEEELMTEEELEPQFTSAGE